MREVRQLVSAYMAMATIPAAVTEPHLQCSLLSTHNGDTRPNLIAAA